MPSPRTLCDLFDRTVAERGPQLALRSDDGSFVLTWSEYAAQAKAAAAGLAGLGVRHGDTVACWLFDRPELDLAHTGALRLGAVPFSLHPTLTHAQAAHAIADAAARVLITEPAFLGAALVVRAGRTPLRIISSSRAPTRARSPGPSCSIAHPPTSIPTARQGRCNPTTPRP